MQTSVLRLVSAVIEFNCCFICIKPRRKVFPPILSIGERNERLADNHRNLIDNLQRDWQFAHELPLSRCDVTLLLNTAMGFYAEFIQLNRMYVHSINWNKAINLVSCMWVLCLGKQRLLDEISEYQANKELINSGLDHKKAHDFWKRLNQCKRKPNW